MFQPGEPVPSITDLAAERGLPPRLCARALQTLAAEGALTRYAELGY
jgi:DNA-binding transcriptional regulator YhcF (GntR family)